MKKVCTNWAATFTSDLVSAKYWDEFKQNATNAAAEIHEVNSWAEAQAKVLELIAEQKATKICGVGHEENAEVAKIYETIRGLEGVTLHTDKFEIAEHAEQSHVGISCAEFHIAETGSVCVDTKSYEARVTSMLPELHIVFLNKNHGVNTVEDAFKVISPVFTSGHMGFITGPSRTADIERVLTIGVHGPGRFVIIAIDETNGGAA